MNIRTRIAAMTMAVVMAVAVTGCTGGEDTAWILQDGETKMPSGIYLQNLISAHNEAGSKTEDFETDILKQKIEDLPAPEWITNRAKELTKEYIAIERKATELGVTLKPEDVEYVKSMVEYQWSMYGELYEENGVSRESFTAVMSNSMLASSLFEFYYGATGPAAISEADYKTAFETDYTRSQFVRYKKEEIVTDPSSSEAASSSEASSQPASSSEASSSTASSLPATPPAEAEKKITAMEQAEAALKSLNSGVSMFSIMTDAEKLTLAEGEELHEHTDESVHDTILNSNTEGVPSAYLAAVKEMKVGDYKIVEDETHVYVIKKLELDADGKALEAYKGEILSELKGEGFEALISEWGKAIADVKFNDAAVKKLTPDKIIWG